MDMKTVGYIALFVAAMAVTYRMQINLERTHKALEYAVLWALNIGWIFYALSAPGKPISESHDFWMRLTTPAFVVYATGVVAGLLLSGLKIMAYDAGDRYSKEKESPPTPSKLPEPLPMKMAAE